MNALKSTDAYPNTKDAPPVIHGRQVLNLSHRPGRLTVIDSGKPGSKWPMTGGQYFFVAEVKNPTRKIFISPPLVILELIMHNANRTIEESARSAPSYKSKVSSPDGECYRLKFLEPIQVSMVDEALASLGDYGEVRLVIEKGRLRFLVTQKSFDAMHWQPGSSLG